MAKRKITKEKEIDALPGSEKQEQRPEVNVSVEYIQVRIPVAIGIPSEHHCGRRYDVYLDEPEQAEGFNALVTALRMIGATAGQHSLPVETKSHALRWLASQIADSIRESDSRD